MQRQKNVHQPSSLISEAQVQKIARVLQSIWSRETCFPDQRGQWSEENLALGQCAATALIIHDLYGGVFANDTQNHHVWNILPDGSEHDFSRMQFSVGVHIQRSKMRQRDDLLHHPRAQQVEMKERYQLLKKSFEEKYI